ncbi:MAG: methyltransferase [bacterium]|nr:methyltransferase [bacterium]
MLEDLPYEHGGDNIPCRDGRLLYDVIVEHGYQRGLELGTSNGYSTLWLGLAFRKTGGRVITVEIDPQRAREARRNFVEAGLDGVIDSRINDALAELRNLEGELDFVFLDAVKADYVEYLKLLRDKISPGGAITAHNALSHEREMREFLDAVHDDPDLETTIHRSSREGISVSIRRR